LGIDTLALVVFPVAIVVLCLGRVDVRLHRLD
jgi:hypothetical protein